jgi:alpha-amylase/alpha-mannosidase (GH57 family)
MRKTIMGVYLVDIHGHFYQPPRERFALRPPHSLGIVPLIERSAKTGINWTERILKECYQKLMGETPAKSAYASISFNFGPTLIEQLRVLAPGFVENLVAADLASRTEHGRHGNAIAQGFNHTILPLSNESDREIQVVWGLEHFKNLFGREAEGFWLPECAVDAATLKLLSAQGVKFVILSPYQAKSLREKENWQPIQFFGGLPGIRYDKIYHATEQLGSSDLNIFLYDPWLARSWLFMGCWQKAQTPKAWRNRSATALIIIQLS